MKLCFYTPQRVFAPNSEDVRSHIYSSVLSSITRGSVLRDTLSSWVKILLDAAGTDTMQFNPHSTRAASTTAARGNSVSLQEMLNTALP